MTRTLTQFVATAFSCLLLCNGEVNAALVTSDFSLSLGVDDGNASTVDLFSDGFTFDPISSIFSDARGAGFSLTTQVSGSSPPFAAVPNANPTSTGVGSNGIESGERLNVTIAISPTTPSNASLFLTGFSVEGDGFDYILSGQSINGVFGFQTSNSPSVAFSELITERTPETITILFDNSNGHSSFRASEIHFRLQYDSVAVPEPTGFLSMVLVGSGVLASRRRRML